MVRLWKRSEHERAKKAAGIRATAVGVAGSDASFGMRWCCWLAWRLARVLHVRMVGMRGVVSISQSIAPERPLRRALNIAFGCDF